MMRTAMSGEGRRASQPAARLLLFLVTATLLAVLPAGAQSLRIEPGRLVTFEISAPAAARVGEPVSLVVTARDAAGNAVTNYDRTGGGVVFTSNAVSTADAARASGVEPNRFPASAFREGRLTAEVILTRAGATEIEVMDPAQRVTSRTGRIDVRPGAVANVKVLAPAAARVGEPFDVVIELYDRFGNPVVDFDRFGTEVLLKPGLAGAVGRFEPARVLPTHFSLGRASVKVRYTQAENTSLMAEAAPARGISSPFEVRAGALHAFGVTVPARPVVAGEPFGIVIEAKDQSGNTVTDFNRVGGVVELRSTGSGTVDPATIPPTAFVGGIAMVNVRYNVAEKIAIVAQDATGAKRGESASRVEVLGGRLGRFEVLPAESARAGEPLAVQIVAYDVFGNVIRDFGGRNLRAVVTAADASPLEAPLMTARSFNDGVALVTVTPARAGQVVLQVVDETTGAGGRSHPVRVRAGEPAAFEVRVPSTVIAHEPFEAEITALDRFGNVIEDYNRSGAGVVLGRAGSGDVAPASVPPSAFDHGMARVKFTYNTAEEITLAVTEQGGTASGRSSLVLVAHAAPRRFKVDAPSRAVAGEPTRLTVTALDDFGNPVVAFSALNRNVTLYAENGEPLTPPTVSAAAFRRGVAEVDVLFLRTGDAVVVAEAEGGRVAGKSAVLRVVPAAPASLIVTAPGSIPAGTPMNVRIEMSDRLGNRIRDYSPPATSLSIRVLGANGAASSGSIELGAASQMRFREGLAEVSVLPKKAEEIVVEVTDEMLRVSGRSGAVRISAGPVDHFAVESLSPEGLRAGEPMKLRITAYDAFENAVSDYGADGGGARLMARVSTATPASGVFLPSTLRGDAFRDGRAVIYALYDKAEAVTMTVDRLSAGAVTRPEVVTAVAAEQAGGTLLSIILNGPARRAEIRRLTESLFEMIIPGAILSSTGSAVTRTAGVVSLVALSQAEEGVRVLIHASTAASIRAAEDANRILVNVDPVIAGMPAYTAPVAVALPTVGAAVAGAAASNAAAPSLSGLLPTITDVDRLVRENRFAEALQAVNILVGARPNDAALLTLKRRLELLSAFTPSRPASPAAPPVSSAPREFVPLQTIPQPVQTASEPAQPTLAAAEAAVRAGKYRDALTILDAYLATRPADEAALRMKQRIHLLLPVLEGDRTGGSAGAR